MHYSGHPRILTEPIEPDTVWHGVHDQRTAQDTTEYGQRSLYSVRPVAPAVVLVQLAVFRTTRSTDLVSVVVISATLGNVKDDTVMVVTADR